MLSIRLLGAPELLLNQQPVTITRRKSRALLYYIAAHPTPLTREHLLAFFWPDADRASAQQTLRTTLHGLRKALGASLVVDDDTIALAPDVDVDVRRFESNLQPPTTNFHLLASTLQFYRADFLSDFTLPDSPEFDDWVVVERERYRRLMVRGLLALSQLHERGQQYAAALDALERALAFDSLQEDVQRAALRLHYLAGDRAGAIRRYEQFRKLLNDEMGVPPMAETRAVYDAIITDKLQLPTSNLQSPISNLQSSIFNLQPPTSNTLPFTGRAMELEALRGLASSHQFALIEGEAGIGKTRLAEEFMQTTAALSLVGRARELEYALPYQPIVEALRGLVNRADWPALRANLDWLPVWQSEVARLLPEFAIAADGDSQERGNPALVNVTPDNESRLWEGVFQWLRSLARQRPVMVLLDDLHWADASTLALLGYLVRRVAVMRLPITLLATTRPVATRSPLAALRQSLARDGRLESLTLQRLSADDALALAKHLSPLYAHPLADWLARVSEGNPYILSELVREARAQHILLTDGTLNLDALSTSPMVPQSIYTLIQSRLARLSDGARRVLDVAVAAGREFEFEVVARAAGLSENAVLDALDELRAAALLMPLDGTRFTFDHTLTMEVAYREAGEPRHRLLHRRVAEAMGQVYRHRLDEFVGLVAWHFAEGNAPERAAPYAFRAGRRAARLPAWNEAIAFFEQALSGENDATKRKEIFMALGEARFNAGQAAQAAEAFHDALAIAQSQSDDEVVDAARLALGQALLSQARFTEVVAIAQQVLTAGRPANAARAEFLWGTALSIEGADLTGALARLQRAEALARADAEANTSRLAPIKFEQGSVAAQQGNLQQAVALYQEVLTLANADESNTAWSFRILAHNNLAYHLHLLGDPTASDHAREGLQLAQKAGVLGLQTYLLSTLGEIALAANDLEEAEARFREGLALAEQFANAERIAGLTANLGRVVLQRGQTALAIHHLSTALARADTVGLQHLAAQIRLWLAPLLPPNEARARLAEARAIAESGGRQRLLDEVQRLEKSQIPNPRSQP